VGRRIEASLCLLQLVKHLGGGQRGCLPSCPNQVAAFVGVHESGCLRQPGLILGRDSQEAMLVGLNQLTGLDGTAEDLH